MDTKDRWLMGITAGAIAVALASMAALMVALARNQTIYGPSMAEINAMPPPPQLAMPSGDGSVESAVQQAVGMQTIIIAIGDPDTAGMVPVDLQFAGIPCRATLLGNDHGYAPVALTCSR